MILIIAGRPFHFPVRLTGRRSLVDVAKGLPAGCAPQRWRWAWKRWRSRSGIHQIVVEVPRRPAASPLMNMGAGAACARARLLQMIEDLVRSIDIQLRTQPLHRFGLKASQDEHRAIMAACRAKESGFIVGTEIIADGGMSQM